MDAHKKAINVAMLLPDARQPVEWLVANEPTAIRRLAQKLEREAPGRARECGGEVLLRRPLVRRAATKAWGSPHRQWLRGLTFEHPADQAVFGDYLRAIEQLEERLCTLETQRGEVAQRDPYREPV